MVADHFEGVHACELAPGRRGRACVGGRRNGFAVTGDSTPSGQFGRRAGLVGVDPHQRDLDLLATDHGG